MFKWLAEGLASIGDGLYSIMNACSGSSRFDDYQKYMPGKPVKVLTAEEAMKADRDALRTDYRNLGQYWNVPVQKKGKGRQRVRNER